MSVWLVTQISNNHFYIWQSKSAELSNKEAKSLFLRDFFGDGANVESRFSSNFSVQQLQTRNNVAELIVNQHVSFEIIPKDRL